MAAISEICINGRGAFAAAAGARVLGFIGRAAEYVRAAGALLGEATAWYDARDAAWRRTQAKR